MKILIIVVAYNRTKSVSRLLKSLECSYYDNDIVDIIVSIDKSNVEQDIKSIVDDFNWIHGNKQVRTFNERQGLRNHVLQCGDLVEDYDGVIMLEDDIIVSKGFYLYARDAMNNYLNNNAIGGISLYLPQINVMTDKLFEPMKIDSDVFYMQLAQSWGQCWTKEMWFSFKKWYKNNDGDILYSHDIPSKVTKWPKSSWLKYFMTFLVTNDKYFVYPYVSLVTNTTEVGEHNKVKSNLFQVPMPQDYKKDYKFIEFNHGVKYDIFFERVDLNIVCENGIEENDLCVDLYCSRVSNQKRRYVISQKRMNYDVLKSYGMSLHPIEANILYDSEGKDIFLYDLKTNESIRLDGRYNKNHEAMFFNTNSWKISMRSGTYGFINAVRFKLKRLMKF